MKVELTLEEMLVIRVALDASAKGLRMNSLEYVLFERFTSILLGDY